MDNNLFAAGIPMGFGMALMQNPEAYMAFMALDKEQQDSLVEGTHSISSKEEMRKYVDSILNM